MTAPNTSASVSTRINNAIATITFTDPASNSFASKQLIELTQQINHLNTISQVQVIVLQSQGNGVFCAGASFDELLTISTEKEGTTFFSGFANVINAMRGSKKIIIGRVQGKAVGGGVGLIAACDYVFATQNASFKLSELSIGIGPFVIEPVISRKIGKTAMAQVALAAHRWHLAQWGYEKGLYTEIFENSTDMDQALDLFSTQLASYNPEALLEIKQVMWENTQHWQTLLYERAAISGKLVLSNFTKKALAQFKK
jgi:methylglutaconyl-CoA hydratase